MLPVYLTKNLGTGSSTGVGTFSSGGTVTLSTVTAATNFATGRRLLIWGSSALGATVKITGLSEGGTPISESVASSTVVGGSAETTQDFASVTAITVSCAVASTAGYIGTSSRGGTPWYVVDPTRNPMNVEFSLNPSSTSILASLEYTLDYPSYNVQQGVWNTANSTSGPAPTISSLGSSVTALTAGLINFPISAVRVLLTSSSSAAGTINATILQSG